MVGPDKTQLSSSFYLNACLLYDWSIYLILPTALLQYTDTNLQSHKDNTIIIISVFGCERLFDF